MSIRIVLVKTWHAGNIGAVARAMKNMGLANLYLVDPVSFPDDEATSRAGQATDVLERAVVVGTLEEALLDCSLVIGTSARNRAIALPRLTPAKAAGMAVEQASTSNVAIVFGRERTGLLNTEIQQCHFQLNIDAHPDYPVLNLSQAVQLVSYELFNATAKETVHPAESDQIVYPTQQALTHFYEHLESTSNQIGFTNPAHPGEVVENLKAIFRRARLSEKEVRMLRGFLSKAEH